MYYYLDAEATPQSENFGDDMERPQINLQHTEACPPYLSTRSTLLLFVVIVAEPVRLKISWNSDLLSYQSIHNTLFIYMVVCLYGFYFVCLLAWLIGCFFVCLSICLIDFFSVFSSFVFIALIESFCFRLLFQ